MPLTPMGTQPTTVMSTMAQTETAAIDTSGVPISLATVNRFIRTKPQYRDSFEEPEAFRMNTSFGTVLVWRVKDRVAQIWNRLFTSLLTLIEAKKNELDVAHQKAAKDGHAGPRDPLWLLRCFLLGVDKDHARPHVAVLCDVEWCTIALRDMINKSDLLKADGWCCFRLPYSVTQPGWTSEWGSNADFEQYEIHAFEPRQSSYGFALQFEVKRDGITKGAATIGGVVEVGGLLLGMTAGHVFHAHNKHPSSTGFSMDEDELGLFAYGDDAGNNIDDFQCSTQLTNLELRDDDEMLKETDASSALQKPRCIGHLKEISRDFDEESQNSLGRLRLDWALVAMDRSHRHLLEPPDVELGSAPLHLSGVSNEIPDHSTKVFINVPSENPRDYSGSGTGSVAVTNIPGSNRLQTVHICVMMGHSWFKDGDCGSWAFERTPNSARVKFVGMLVATSLALNEAYLLPAHDILLDIEKNSGRRVLLPTRLMQWELATTLEVGPLSKTLLPSLMAERAKTFRIGHEYALQVLYEPKRANDGSNVDIVFVHGLFGNRVTTWTKDGVFWPKELLPEDVSKARILTFGYDAQVTRFDADYEVTQSTMESHALDICDRLTGLRAETSTAERPIIFVAHSLGGLVCAQMLIIGDRNEPDSNAASIAEHSRGMIFLGTPFRGWENAFWGNQLGLLLLGIRTNPPLISNLQETFQQLHALAIAFPEVLMKRLKAEDGKLQVFFCYETLEYEHGMIVERESAWIPGCGDCVPIRADHFNICKFAERQEDGYILLVSLVNKVFNMMRVPSKPKIVISNDGDIAASRKHGGKITAVIEGGSIVVEHIVSENLVFNKSSKST